MEDEKTAVVADMKAKGAIITDSAIVLDMVPLFWSNKKVDNCGRFDGCTNKRGLDLR